MGLLGQIFSRRRRYDDISVSIQEHIDERADELVADGMTRKEAEQTARREFGNATLMEQRSREVWQLARLESLWADMQQGLRQIRKWPGFAVAVVLTMALGIGATTLIFTLVYATLLRSLPYSHAERIIHIKDERLQGQSTAGMMGVLRFFDLHARTRSIENLSFFYFDRKTLVWDTHLPVAVKGVSTNWEFWKVFDVQPLLGRTFNESEDQPYVPDAIVLSYSGWQRIFGGDPNVLNKKVAFAGEAATIVGIMPQNFAEPAGIDLWHPAHFTPGWTTSRNEGTRFINVFARLKEGTSLATAQQDFQRIGEQLQREYPSTDVVWQFTSETLRDDLYGGLRPALLVLLSTSGFLLLIACINVANLLSSRATSREREVALRRALGASSRRILQQFLVESILLALLGGGIGLASAFVLVHATSGKLPGRLGTPGVVEMHWPVMWFALGISVFTGVAFGLVPASMSRRLALNTSLKHSDSRLSSTSGNKVRNGFIAVQVGLSLVLLIGASLLGESFWKLVKSPLGFEPDHRLTFSINLPWYTKDAETHNFYTGVQQRLESLPGVIAVGQIDALPTINWQLRSSFDADWLPRIPNHPQINAEDRHIAGDYLKAMGIPLLAGRGFTQADLNAKPIRIMVNQQLVQQYLPDGNPIGKHLLYGKDSFEIVGVIGNVRGTAGSIANHPGAEIYWPADMVNDGVVQRYFILRSHLPPEQLIEAVREQVHQVDAQQAIGNVSTMDDLLDQAVAQPRFNILLVAFFAFTALLLACVGIYGVVAYSVAQRTQEIGVRMALGATRKQISLHFMRRTLTAAAVGMAIGACVALVLSRFLVSQLYGVDPASAPVYLLAALLLLIPITLATLQPAWKASGVNPTEALRAE